MTINGDQLVVRGPKSAEPVAKRLLENKAAVMAAVVFDDLRRMVARVRRPPGPREWVHTDDQFRRGAEVCLELAKEALDAGDLDLFQRRVELVRQVAEGMPAIEPSRN